MLLLDFEVHSLLRSELIVTYHEGVQRVGSPQDPAYGVGNTVTGQMRRDLLDESIDSLDGTTLEFHRE